MKKKFLIFVGAALYHHDMRNPKPCMFFPETGKLITANSVSELAHRNAEKLGCDWRNKVTHEKPHREILLDGELKYELVEFISVSKKIFEESVTEALDCH